VGRWLIVLVLLVAAVATAAVIWQRQGAATGQRTLVERLERGVFIREISGTGIVEAAQERTLTFATSGTVAELLVQEGQRVAAGTVLARLDTTAITRELTTARTNLASAQADLNNLIAQQRVDQLELQTAVTSQQNALASAEQAVREAQTQLATTEQLFNAGAASRSELERAQDALSQALRQQQQAAVSLEAARQRVESFGPLALARRASSEANITSLQTRIATLEETLRDTELIAPFGGVVASIGFKVGDLVGPQQSLRLVDTSQLSVRARFDENRALELAPGQAATIAPDADAGLRLAAVVSRINPVAVREGGAAQLIAHLDFQNRADAQLVKPGFTVTARVVVNRLDDVLLVPLEAITERDGLAWVTRVRESEPGRGSAERVEITVLDRNPTLAAARPATGALLEAGELIAVINLDALTDGTAVVYTPLSP
jgi:HlyD family secretion protein